MITQNFNEFFPILWKIFWDLTIYGSQKLKIQSHTGNNKYFDEEWQEKNEKMRNQGENESKIAEMIRKLVSLT